AANLPAKWTAGTRLRAQYSTSRSVKMRCTNRSPYRSIAAAMRSMSAASRPSPRMFTLPKPNDRFEWVQDAAGPALVCRPLEGLATHLFTTRGWPLGSSRDAWDDVARAVDVPLARLIRARQVHGADVVVHRRGGIFSPLADAARPAADILMTDDRTCAAAI